MKKIALLLLVLSSTSLLIAGSGSCPCGTKATEETTEMQGKPICVKEDNVEQANSEEQSTEVTPVSNPE